MPKSTKAAPPQQSKLEEMWGKNKRPKVETGEDNKMEVEEPVAESSKHPGASYVWMLSR